MSGPPRIEQSGQTPQDHPRALPMERRSNALSSLGRIFSRGNRSSTADRTNAIINEGTAHPIAGNTHASSSSSSTRIGSQSPRVGKTRKGNLISNLFKRKIRVSKELKNALLEHTRENYTWGAGVIEPVRDRLVNFAEKHPDPEAGIRTLENLNQILNKLPIGLRSNAISEISMFFNENPAQAERVISLMSQVHEGDDLYNFITLLIKVSINGDRYEFVDAPQIRDWSRLDDNRLKELMCDEAGNDSVEILIRNAKATGFLISVIDYNYNEHPLNFNVKREDYIFGDEFQSAVITLAQIGEYPEPNIELDLLKKSIDNPNIPPNKKLHALSYLSELQNKFPILKGQPDEVLAPLFAPLQGKSVKEALASFEQSYHEIESLVKDLASKSSSHADIDEKIQQTFGEGASLNYALLKILKSQSSPEEIIEINNNLNRNYATLMQHDCNYALVAINDRNDRLVIDLLNTDRGKQWYRSLEESTTEKSNSSPAVTVTNFILSHQSDIPGFSAELAPVVKRMNDSVGISVWKGLVSHGPEEILRVLNDHLSPVPNTIAVQFRGEHGIDAGGLVREFTTDIYAAFIKNNFENGLPKGRGDGLKEEFQALGKMMAFALERNGERPLGKKLDRKVFAALKNIDISSNEFSSVSKLTILSIIDPTLDPTTVNGLIKFLNSDQKSAINEENQNFLNSIAELFTVFDDYRTEDGSLDFKEIQNKLSLFKKELFEEFEGLCKVNERVMPYYHMAQGFYADPKIRTHVDQLTYQEMDVAVQGEVNREAILKALNFAPPDSNEAAVLPLKLQNVIKGWIQKANNSQLENLLKVMTGSPSLGEDKTLTIVTKQDDKHLDSAQTCFNRLTINRNFINNEESLVNYLNDIGDGKAPETFNIR